MSDKDDAVRRLKWNSEKRLEYVKSRLEANPGPTKRMEAGNPMTDEEGRKWWELYIELKTIQTIAEQDLAWAKKYLGEDTDN